MTLPLFNPPEPGAQPTIPRNELTTGNWTSACGTCISVPKYWQIIGTAKAGASPYTQLFMSQILLRDFPSWTQYPYTCQWTSIFDLFATTGIHQFGSILLLAGSGQLPWTVTFNGNTRTPPGVDDIEVYSQQAFGFPDTRPWRCLNPNTLYHTGLGAGNFDHMPDSILLQPFWP
jgi:hypothetical protein